MSLDKKKYDKTIFKKGNVNSQLKVKFLTH